VHLIAQPTYPVIPCGGSTLVSGSFVAHRNCPSGFLVHSAANILAEARSSTTKIVVRSTTATELSAIVLQSFLPVVCLPADYGCEYSVRHTSQRTVTAPKGVRIMQNWVRYHSPIQQHIIRMLLLDTQPVMVSNKLKLRLHYNKVLFTVTS